MLQMRHLLTALRGSARVKSAVRALVAAAICAYILRQTYLVTRNDCVTALASNLHAASFLPPSNRMAGLHLPAVCANESCRADYVRHLQAADVRPIPAIRHILWRTELVSQHFAEQLRSWQRIHPDWTYVLWRDRDLVPFVATYFPDLLAKFRSLPKHIMRVDMIRYMLLYQFGGTYADLDYTLVRSLDTHRCFHAVITREPEAHSLQHFGMSWPTKLMASPAFMMSAPRHSFNFFAIETLRCRKPDADDFLSFAGPLALTSFIEKYENLLPVAAHAMETVYVPPSRSFYPYPDNRMVRMNKIFREFRALNLDRACRRYLSQDDSPMKPPSSLSPQLVQYCRDVSNLDPITDRSQPAFAVHDLDKSGSAYGVLRLKSGNIGNNDVYYENMTDARLAIPNLILGPDFISSSRP